MSRNHQKQKQWKLKTTTQNRRYNYWSRILGCKSLLIMKEIFQIISKQRVATKVQNCPPNFQHRHNVVQYGKCPSEGCKNDYIGETESRIVERIKYHNNKNNGITRENGQTDVLRKIVNQNLNKKLSEFLFIRQLKPMLNVNEKSTTLNLFS